MRGGTEYTVSGEWEGWGMNLGFRAMEGVVDEVQDSKVSTQRSTEKMPIHRVREFGREFPKNINDENIVEIES
jgi:hypothetical protein